jgi:acyl-CoA thioesterase YciA
MTETPSGKLSHPAVPPSASPAIRTIAMPRDTNQNGDIFGGWIMSQMDLAAGNIACKISRGRCATVAVEGMAFITPVHVGDEVTLWAEPTRLGRTSMTFDVQAWARPRDGDEQVVCVTRAQFTFVAIDANGRPRSLPHRA